LVAASDRRTVLADLSTNAIDVEVHEHAVGYGLFVVVLHHKILIEEAKGLLGGRRGQSNQRCVKVLQNLPPQVVDGAMTLIGDNEVEGLDRQPRIVFDRDGHLLQTCHVEGRLLFQFRVELLFSLQHRVQPLNCRDADAAHSIELVRLHELDVIKLGERTVLVWRDERLKFLERLTAKVGAINQEKHAPCSPVLDEAIDKVAGSVGLAAAAGHLDQCPWPLLGKRDFQIFDGLDLCWPQLLFRQRREMVEQSPNRRPRMLQLIL